MSVERFEVGKLYRLVIDNHNVYKNTGHVIYMVLAVDTRTYQDSSVWMAQVVLPDSTVRWTYLTLHNWELVETS